jgi:hypothetical protein
LGREWDSRISIESKCDIYFAVEVAGHGKFNERTNSIILPPIFVSHCNSNYIAPSDFGLLLGSKVMCPNPSVSPASPARWNLPSGQKGAGKQWFRQADFCNPLSR